MEQRMLSANSDSSPCFALGGQYALLASPLPPLAGHPLRVWNLLGGQADFRVRFADVLLPPTGGHEMRSPRGVVRRG
jgi:hypothetical protein